MKGVWIALALALLLATGCGREIKFAANPPASPQATQEEEPARRRGPAPVGGVLLEDPWSAPAPAAQDTPPPVGQQPAETDSPQEPAEDVVREKAEVGAGKKGRYEGSGLVVTPLKAYFGVQQRVVYEVQIPHALNLYQAVEGRKPASHEEFMEKIIAANQIQLPELPQGHRYVYDPQRGELMVERPR